MSLAVTSRSPDASMRSTFGSSVFIFKGKPLRFKMMFVVSSTTPGIVENSCRTPSILTYVTAVPGSEDSKSRRNALPSVMPKPRSSGSIVNFA